MSQMGGNEDMLGVPPEADWENPQLLQGVTVGSPLQTDL